MRTTLLTALVLLLAACGAGTDLDERSPVPVGVPTSSPSASRRPAPPVEPLTVHHPVDWERVGADWQLVVTMSGRHEQGDLVDPDRMRLQLLSPTGERLDLVVMDDDVLPASRTPRWAWPYPQVEDVDPTTRTALLLFRSDFRDATAISVDLVTGGQQRVRVPRGTTGLVLREGGVAALSFRGHLAVVDWDGSTRRLGRASDSALPLADRSGVVTTRPLRVASYDGSSRALTKPSGSGACRPRRWWDADTVLVSCSQGSLWRVPVDGSPPSLITRDADPHAGRLDFGSGDAVRLGEEIFVQREAGCGAGWIARAEPNGSTTNLDGLREQSLVGTLGDRLVVRRWESCTSGPRTALVLLDPRSLDARPLLTLADDEELSGVFSWDGTPRIVS